MKPVKWGVLSVSYHYQLRLSIPIANSPLVDMTAVASRSKEKAQRAADMFCIPKAYGSYEELLKDKEIEAVFIPLPNHLHAEWVKKAADAGKHILCEKPFGMSADEVQDAVDYAKSKGVLVMEAFMYRFHSQWQRIRDLVAVGEIGGLQSIHSFFAYNLTDPDNIRNKPEAGGGALRDIGVYTVSSARFIVGREPRRVISLVDRDSRFGTDTLVSAILDYDYVRSVFTIGTLTHPYQRMDIHGSGGYATIHVPYNMFPDVPAQVTIVNGVGTRDLFLGPEDQYALQFDAFSQAVRNGGPEPTPPEDAVANQKVIDALFRSEKSGNWEDV